MGYSFPNSPINETFDIGITEGTASIVYIVPYASVAAVTGGMLDKDNPSYHPLYPGLICKTVNAVLLNDYTETSFRNVTCTLNYGIPEAEEDEDLISLSIGISGEVMVLPKEGFENGSPGDKEKIDDICPNPHKVLPKTTLDFTVHHSLTYNAHDFEDMWGEVNDAVFFDYAAGHVMYLGSTGDKTLTTAGDDDWSVTHSFEVNPHGWNHVWRPATAQWEPIVPVLYTDTDFAAIGVGVA